MTLEEAYNSQIAESKQRGSIDTNKISDGYHTFGELYEHRIALWITVCRLNCRLGEAKVWRSEKHSDDTSFEGWFLLGIHDTNSIQMTYHLPMSKWNECHFAERLETAPAWDGHTSADVLDRLRML